MRQWQGTLNPDLNLSFLAATIQKKLVALLPALQVPVRQPCVFAEDGAIRGREEALSTDTAGLPLERCDIWKRSS